MSNLGRRLTRSARAGLALAAFLALLTLYLAVWPVPVDPVAWTPPEAPPLLGVYAGNVYLAGVERIAAGGAGPEDVAVDALGRLYAGLEDGRLVRILPNGAIEEFAHTGGRPLGLAWDAAGNLLVADAVRGLVSVTPEGQVAVLTSEQGGFRLGLTDDVDVGPDGVIYFSDASLKFGLADYVLDLLEHRPHGRLLAYDPKTRQTRLLLADLYFANGVAVAADGSFVLVVETGAYQVTRYWLAGPQAGAREIVLANLPGFPDGISRGSGGIFWLAIASPRDAVVDTLAEHPGWRKVVARLPPFLRPAPKRHAFVLGIDAQGRVVHNLQDASADSFSPVTSVEEHEGMLYLGALTRQAVARVKTP